MTIAFAAVWDYAGAERIQAQWGHLPYIREPDEPEYYAALARGDFPTTPEVQRDVRLGAWWKRNFPARQIHDRHVPAVTRLDATTLSPEARHNLEALVTLLASDDDQDRLLTAEVYRELGRFAEATQVLRTIRSTDAAPTVARLLGLCDAGDSHVTRLTSKGWLLSQDEMFGVDDDESGAPGQPRS